MRPLRNVDLFDQYEPPPAIRLPDFCPVCKGVKGTEPCTFCEGTGWWPEGKPCPRKVCPACKGDGLEEDLDSGGRGCFEFCTCSTCGGAKTVTGHVWKSQVMGGSPDTAEASEVVSFCDVCGVENQGSGVLQ